MSKKKRPTPVPPERLFPLFDAHTHLGSCGATTEESIRALLDRAADTGVVGVCTVGDAMAETELAFEAAGLDPRVVAACAIHPTKSYELDDQARHRLTEMAHDDRCVAIGEAGLDYYWLGSTDVECADKPTQHEALRWHCELADAVNKPLMVHNREADDDLLALLSDFPNLTVMLHCFSSPLSVAERALERGYILSFTGNVTFKRNDELRQAAAIAPEGQVLVETDAPYMTPEPFRGARNESTYIGYTARVIAQVRGEDPQACAEHLTRSALRLFGLAEEEWLKITNL